MDNKKCSLIYDEYEVIESEVKHYLEEENEENKTEEEVREMFWDNPFILEDYWNLFKEDFGECLKEIDKNGYFKVKGVKMGWRNLTGFKVVETTDGEEFLREILPNTSEFSLYVWKMKTQIVIKCSHHDSPTGEYYYIKPLSKKEISENEFF